MKFAKFLFLIIFCLPVIAWGSQNLKTAPEVGALGPDFTLKDLKGADWQLNSLKGKVILLNFWATWCPPCKKEVPSIEKLSRLLKKENFLVVAVSVDQDPARLKDFIKKNKITFLVLNDETQAAATKYLVRGIPTNFIIGKGGVIVFKEVGSRDWATDEQVKYFKELINK